MIAAKAPRSEEDLLRISKQELRKEACCSMLHAMFMWIFDICHIFPICWAHFEFWNRSHAPELEKNGTCRKVRRTILLISLEANLQKKRADLSGRLVAIKRFCGIPRSFCTWMIKLQGLEELFQKAQDYLTSQFAAYWKT